MSFVGQGCAGGWGWRWWVVPRRGSSVSQQETVRVELELAGARVRDQGMRGRRAAGRAGAAMAGWGGRSLDPRRRGWVARARA